VRSYFSAGHSRSKKTPGLADKDRGEKTADQAIHPSLTGWLPSEKLFDKWRRLHEP